MQSSFYPLRAKLLEPTAVFSKRRGLPLRSKSSLHAISLAGLLRGVEGGGSGEGERACDRIP